MRRWTPLALLFGFLSSGCGDENDAPPTGEHERGAAPTGDGHVHPGAGGPAGSRPEGPVTRKHVELLEIARRLRASGETYFGEGSRRQLAAVDTTGMSPEDLAEHEFRLAWESFKLGRAEEAERLFLSSLERFPNVRARYMLGVAQLRIGELGNCIHHHSPESCVFPLRGGGVHVDPSGAERAFATLVATIDQTPIQFRPQVRWFVNLAAMALGRHPGDLPPTVLIESDKLASKHDIGRFPDVAMSLGISPMNLAGGTVLDDFDGDGLLDLVTSTADIEGQLLYYRNEGNGTFRDRTSESGLVGQLGGLNLIHADYDDDGHRDLLVLRGGWMGTWGRIPNSLLRSRGDGTFTDVTDQAGLGAEHYPSQTAAFADYDLDGDLDLYLGNEMPPPQSGLDYPCQLFRNEGDGTFTDVTTMAGVGNHKLAKGVAWGDWDGDRDPDLYVSNQFDVNRLYRNEGDGTFTDVAPDLGVDEPRFSFPVWFWDYDNDGALDLFVAGYGGDLGLFVRSLLRPSERFGLNALYRNEGGVFRDHAKAAGLTLQSLTMGANFGDLDNDGWLDFYLGTGTPDFDALMPNVMYRNDGGRRFQDVTESGGFGNLQKGHGIAFGDLDNDGDQDIYAQLGGIYAYDAYFNSLFLNPGHGNRWITLELVGTVSNRDALGSRIRVRFVEDGETRDVYRWMWPQGSFGSAPFRREIGLGRAERIDFVEIYWPKTDVTQRFEGLELDSFYRIEEGGERPRAVKRRSVSLTGG